MHQFGHGYMSCRGGRSTGRPLMVSDGSPASFNARAPPACKLCDETWFIVYPRFSSPSTVAPHQIAVVISLSETRVGCFEGEGGADWAGGGAMHDVV